MASFICTQTDISLPHVMRNIMWSTSCFWSIVEADVDNSSGAETSAPNASSSVLDIDVTIEDDDDIEGNEHARNNNENKCENCNKDVKEQ